MFRYGATALQANTWYHVTGVYNAATSELHVYLNGQLDDGTLSARSPRPAELHLPTSSIGRRPSRRLQLFGGRIDDVRIYSRALTQPQIQADMNTPVGGGALTAMNLSTHAERPAFLPRRLADTPRARRLGMPFTIEPFAPPHRVTRRRWSEAMVVLDKTGA